jgi:putative transcriptional regulator
MGDGNFFSSVVLMIKHDEEGAFGVVLNRPTANTVQDIWQMVGEEPTNCTHPIYLGGPVGGPLVALHRLKSCAEAEVMPGIYFAAHKDQLRKIVSQTKSAFRFFTGYAGWAGGQLEDEMEAGGWLTMPASKELVFYKQDDLWDHVASAIGAEVLGAAIKTRHVPDDPSLN